MHIVLAFHGCIPCLLVVAVEGDYAVLQTRIMALALPFVAISLLAE